MWKITYDIKHSSGLKTTGIEEFFTTWNKAENRREQLLLLSIPGYGEYYNFKMKYVGE